MPVVSGSFTIFSRSLPAMQAAVESESADAAPADKSYELWAVEPGQDPKSLGVVEQASFTRSLPYKPQDLVFAISLEPKGGSPTGKATGPVIFSGPLLQSN